MIILDGIKKDSLVVFRDTQVLMLTCRHSYCDSQYETHLRLLYLYLERSSLSVNAPSPTCRLGRSPVMRFSLHQEQLILFCAIQYTLKGD